MFVFAKWFVVQVFEEKEHLKFDEKCKSAYVVYEMMSTIIYGFRTKWTSIIYYIYDGWYSYFYKKIIQIFPISWNNNAKITFIVFDIVSYETRSTAYDIVFRKVFFSCQKFIVSTSTLVEKKGGGLAFENYGCFVIWVRRSHIVKNFILKWRYRILFVCESTLAFLHRYFYATTGDI